MKIIDKSILAATGILLSAIGQGSDVTFTRIMDSPLGTDEAYSFGCAWGDYDGDGFLDLVVGNGLGDANALYHNERGAGFTRVTTGAIATTIGDADGCVWADYDNDGDLDLFIANWRMASFLFQNLGAQFVKIEANPFTENVADSNGAAWGDYNNDGFLDLVVANSTGQNEYLYRNNGNGTFTQIFSGPIPTSGMSSGSPTWCDYDNDGRVDLHVSPAGTNANSLSLVFRNQGTGAFVRTNIPAFAGVGYGGTDWGDYDNDGDFDLIGAGWASGFTVGEIVIFRNDGGGAFSRVILGTFDITEAAPGPGVWGDYDNDGWLDLFVVTALPTLAQNDLLYHNNGDGTFTRVTEGEVVNTAATSSGGATWVDYDNDGFLDLFVANGHERAREANSLFKNNGNTNRWLSVRCLGSASNRSGIGAKVHVKATIGGVERWQVRELTGGNGFNSSGLRAHFGLGDARFASVVRVEWPSGTVSERRLVTANQVLPMKEPPVLTLSRTNTNGVVTLTLKGGRGIPYTIEHSANMASWQRLTNFTPTNTLTTVADTITSAGNTFYRAREGN